MVSDNLGTLQSSNHLIEYKKCNDLTIAKKSRHGLCPLCEIIDDQIDVTMPLDEGGWHVIKSTPHLVKGLTMMIGKSRAGCVCILRVKI
jgi:hypothetical protein